MKKINKNSITAAVLGLFLIFGFMGPNTVGAVPPIGLEKVSLGSAEGFVILAKTGISTTGTTKIVGDIGVSPAAGTYITGFSQTMDVTNTFATSDIVTGKIYSATDTEPTPTDMTDSISAMETAYTDAAGRTLPIATELGAGNIGGLTLAPGLYKWGTDVLIPTDVTLSGNATDTWIFQIAGNLEIASAKKVILAGGALPENIFWQVGGVSGVTLGTYSSFSGIILSQKQIVIRTGAALHGRALAQTQVTLDANAISNPTADAPETPVVPVVKKHRTSSGSSPRPYVINTNNNLETVDLGCSNGNLFSTTSGKACNNNSITTNEGCSVGNLFSTSNGKACINNVKSYDFGTLTLRVGSHGEYVKSLQALVGTDVDGLFGPNTKAKVIAWQTAHGLTPDGLFGNASKAKAK